MTLNEFVGKHINAAYINKEKNTMYWIVNGEWYELGAVGDCCSYSWYEHCDSGDVLQNATLTEFEDVSQKSITNDDYEYIRVNMLKFKTDRGYCTIEFRNSSNGYYSGWCQIKENVAPPDISTLKLLGDF